MNVQSLATPNKSTTVIVLAVLLVITLLFTCAFLAPERLLDLFNWGPETWSRSEAEGALGVAIPDEARDLRLEGSPDEVGYLDMRFAAPPAAMAAFTGNFCSGALHAGYDPFNAVDRRQPTEGAVQLTMAEAQYYSYSPGIAEPVAGNRCWDEAIGQIEFVVDQRDPEMHALYLEHRPNCYKCSLPHEPDPAD